MERAPQSEPKSIHPFDNLRSAIHVKTRTPAQDFLGELRIDGKKLSCCHW